MKNLFKYIGYSLVAVIIFASVLELGARLFVPTGSFQYIERCIIEQKMAFKKKPGTFRIFLFGESTMLGNHLDHSSTIKRWIELYLENLLGKDIAGRVQIINFGHLEESSNFFRDAFFDTMVYKPDLAVFYSAHNDFIQLDNRRQFLELSTFKSKAGRFFQRFTRYSAFASFMQRLALRSKLTHNKSMETAEKGREYDPNTDLLAPGGNDFKVIEANWQKNIGRIIQAAQKKNIPVVFFEGVAQYRGLEPSESRHDPNLSDGLARWDILYDFGQKALALGNVDQALSLFEKAEMIDGQHALLLFKMGQVYEQLGQYEKANQYYKKANDGDYFPSRAPSAANKFYAQLRNKKLKGVTIVPAQEIFEKHSANGIVGDDLITGPIHPTAEGQALMALEVVRTIYEKGWFVPKKAWHWDRLKSVEELKQRLGTDNI